MGASISKNVINSMVNNTQSIITNYTNICTLSGTAATAQFNADGCAFKDSNVKVITNQTVNQSCITNSNTKNSITADITQSMQQSATAITQQFGFPSLAAAEDFINTSIDLGNQIVENFYTVCNAEASNASASFTCKNSTFTNSTIDIESYQNIQQTCFQKNISNNTIISKLQQQLSQTTVAKQADTFTAFVIIIAVIILVIAYAGISIAESPLVQWGIVILVLISIVSTIIYSVTAKNNGNYPYVKT